MRDRAKKARRGSSLDLRARWVPGDRASLPRATDHAGSERAENPGTARPRLELRLISIGMPNHACPRHGCRTPLASSSPQPVFREGDVLLACGLHTFGTRRWTATPPRSCPPSDLSLKADSGPNYSPTRPQPTSVVRRSLRWPFCVDGPALVEPGRWMAAEHGSPSGTHCADAG